MMKTYGIWIAALGVAAVVGCDARDRQTRTTPGATDVAAQGTHDDDTTSDEIERRIKADTTLSEDARDVDIDVDSGVVTLKGEVRDAREKTAIENIARQTRGVTRVENELEVEPGDTTPGAAPGTPANPAGTPPL
jgi:osmotically-inducible protein OsmY